jgi:TRAP transporter TAXI family solute receptor
MGRLRDRIRAKLREREELTRREKLKFYLPAIALAIIGFVVAFQFVDPAPPRAISIACGPQEGANFIFAKAYQEFMAQEGVTLNIRTTAGSAENLKLLQAESDGVEVAFVQGGLKSLVQNGHLVSLGSLFFEPLFIFHRTDVAIERISDMKGMRLAVGEEGGGTKILTMHVLQLNGINTENTQILSLGYQSAADMLLKGEVDVAFFVSTHRAPYVIKLIDSKSVKLIGMPRAEAYTFLYHYLYLLRVPEGVINFEANIPPRDLSLVAPTTQLVARSDLHPALVNLLMQAAEDVHESGTEFERQGEFPSPKYLDFELSEEAERFYKTGPPFLQRYLPFWVANFITRMKIMLVPLIVVFFPLFKVIPPIYKWRMRRRIFRWYSELDAVDPDIHREEVAESLQAFLVKLDEIEEKVSKVAVPLGYAEGLYALRVHIEMLRNKLRQAAQKGETSGESDNGRVEDTK